MQTDFAKFGWENGDFRGAELFLEKSRNLIELGLSNSSRFAILQLLKPQHNPERKGTTVKKIQTTFTFKSKENAEKFEGWLRTNTNDRDYGYPKYLSTRQVGVHEFCIEYISESPFARGVATGIDL